MTRRSRSRPEERNTTMRQYRLRTIMALIVVVTVSMWVGMSVEQARQRAQHPAPTTFSIYRKSTRTQSAPKSPSRPAPAVSGEGAKGK
jgi:hypothetical protein